MMSQASTGPPKEKGAPAKSALRDSELRAPYCLRRVLQGARLKEISRAFVSDVLAMRLMNGSNE